MKIAGGLLIAVGAAMAILFQQSNGKFETVPTLIGIVVIVLGIIAFASKPKSKNDKKDN
jgi:uncharacterized membrane protein